MCMFVYLYECREPSKSGTPIYTFGHVVCMYVYYMCMYVYVYVCREPSKSGTPIHTFGHAVCMHD